MSMLSHSRRRVTAALAFVATATIATACSDSHKHEDVTVASARIERLNSGGTVVQTVTVTPSGVTGGPLQLNQGVATTLRVTWLNAANNPDGVMTDVNFVTRLTPAAGSGLVFVLASGQRHQGTLTGATLTASTNVPLSLFHSAENHSDFDANVPVSVVP